MSTILSKQFVEKLKTENSRRVKMIRISGRLLLELFSEGIHDGYNVLSNHLPKDAVIIKAGYANTSDMLEIYIWSKTYEPVPEGMVTPFAPDIIIKKLNQHYAKGQQSNFIIDSQ